MKKIKIILDKIFWLNESICKILLLTICVLMWVVVFGRYFFAYTPSWSEDLIMFCMCWIVMLSGAEAFRRDAHIKITVFQDMLPDRVENKLKIIIDILTCLFFAYMVNAGIDQVISNIPVFYTGFKISKMWTFLSFPVSFILTILAKLEKHINLSLREDNNG